MPDIDKQRKIALELHTLLASLNEKLREAADLHIKVDIESKPYYMIGRPPINKISIKTYSKLLNGD